MTPSNTQKPHLTPEKLVGSRFSKESFKDVKVALVGFCPRPTQLDQYNPITKSEQYFIHVAPSSVQLSQHNGINFLSFYHIYGGPVASALVEELAYYGIKTILAYGLAGGLIPSHQKMGDYYLIERAMAFDGTTPHYTDKKIIHASPMLHKQITTLNPFSPLHRVQAATSDAIYQESDAYLKSAQSANCHIVNCDSSHLFAVSQAVGVECIQMGVISDVAQVGSLQWDSQLADMLAIGKDKPKSPLLLVNQIIQFYVETLLSFVT